MAAPDIQSILREFDPIRRQIAQLEGANAIVPAAIPVPGGMPLDPALDDRLSLAFFCGAAKQMLAAGHGYPDAPKYAWVADPQFYGNSFEAWCQSAIVNFLIGLWEQRVYRCEKPVIARNIHTGSYHIETYETASAYFVCVSYQYLNLINRYSLLNHYLIEAGGRRTGSLPSRPPTKWPGRPSSGRSARNGARSASISIHFC